MNFQTTETSTNNTQSITTCTFSVTDSDCFNKGIGIKCDTSSEAWDAI